jgi:hypothetical protein
LTVWAPVATTRFATRQIKVVLASLASPRLGPANIGICRAVVGNFVMEIIRFFYLPIRTRGCVR